MSRDVPNWLPIAGLVLLALLLIDPLNIWRWAAFCHTLVQIGVGLLVIAVLWQYLHREK